MFSKKKKNRNRNKETQKRWELMQNMRQATGQVFDPNLESRLLLQCLGSRTEKRCEVSVAGLAGPQKAVGETKP